MSKLKKSVDSNVVDDKKALVTCQDTKMQKVEEPPKMPISKSTGIEDQSVSRKILTQCACVSGLGSTPEENAAAVRDTCNLAAELAPTDPLEGLVISQAIALRNKGLDFLAIASNEGIGRDGREIYTRLAVKILRLANESWDLLLRYRNRGPQKYHVVHQHQHVNIANGAQAFVGTVMGGGNGKSEASQG